MGLLDSLKSTFTSTGEASVPPAASFATREGVIYAPVNGVLVNLNEVPDETIASGMLGQGYGIDVYKRQSHGCPVWLRRSRLRRRCS